MLYASSAIHPGSSLCIVRTPLSVQHFGRFIMTALTQSPFFAPTAPQDS